MLALFSITAPFSLFAADDTEEFKKAATAYQEEKFDAAIKSFKKVTEKIFGHEPSFYNLGLIYARLNKYDDSLKAFEQAFLYNPYNLFTLKFIADLHILKKNYPAAIEKLKDLSSRSPQDAEAHLKLGLAAIMQRDPETAINELTAAQTLRPQDAAANLNLAALFMQKGDNEKAKTFLAQVECADFTDQKIIDLCEDLKAPQQEAPLPKLQIDLAGYLLQLSAVEELLSAQLAGFEQSEISKRLALRLQKEAEEAAKRGETPAAEAKLAAKKKRPFNLTAELNQTVENYDRNPATSSPINDVNTTTNLKFEGKAKDISVKTEFESYYNRWDHTDLDYFKVNAKDNKDDEVDIGKFSAKNFPNLVSHPSIEQGGRWWHSFQKKPAKGLFYCLPPEPETFGEAGNTLPIPSLSALYKDTCLGEEMFKTWELTVVRGRSKEPRNLNKPKLKNDRTYETSGQFEQWVNAVHLMAKPTAITEMGISYSRVKDDELSALVSSTTLPLESEAIGIDGKIDLLDGKLKTNGEFAWSNFDDNLLTDVKNKQDAGSTFGISYKYIPNWELSYDLKRIGTNFKVEGAYQTQDKITQTLVTKYSAPKNIPWRIRTIDVKFEPARTNLPESGTTTTTYYRTLQPKISFNLPKEAKLSFDYKWYFERSTCECTYYRTETLKTEFEYECKPIKTTFKPSYTFERKDELTATPTDEKQKDYAFIIENKSVKNLTLKTTYERDRKNYVGTNTKAYDNKKFSLETEYAFIPNRFTATFKGSSDDKSQTDTNSILLNTFDWTFNFTSKDGNKKMVLEYERKLNIYKPWSEASAYKQNYAKMKYTQKF